MSFYMYENWQAGAHKTVIHIDSCGFCNSGKGLAGGYDPKHAKWHGPFDTIVQARIASAALPRVVKRMEHTCTR